MSKNQGTKEALSTFYEKPDIQFPQDKEVIGTPGGPLFTTKGLSSVGVDIEDIMPEDAVVFGGFNFSGQELKHIVGFYDMLVENGAVLVCMDPRLDGALKLSSGCMHANCGAAGVLADGFTINGDKPDGIPSKGDQIELAVQANLKQENILPIHEMDPVGHSDSGVITFLGERSGMLPDNVKEEMISKGLGGAYHLGLNVPKIEEYINKKGVDDSQAGLFIKALVELNLGIALSIAESHNSFDVKGLGFHSVMVDEHKVSGSKEGKQVLEHINRLLSAGVQGVPVTNHTFSD